MPVRRHSSQRGLSTIETLVGVVILGVLSGAGFSVMKSGTVAFSRESRIAGMQTDLAAAETVFLDEAMIAGFSPDGVAGALGTFQAVTAGTSSDRLQFVADVDSNGISDLVTYDLANGAFRRTVQARANGAWAAGSTETLATNVQSLSLTFLDANRAPLTGAQVVAGGTALARYVRISLAASGSSRAGAVSKTLLGEVAFRD